MALHKLVRRNYGGKPLMSIKYQNLCSVKKYKQSTRIKALE